MAQFVPKTGGELQDAARARFNFVVVPPAQLSDQNVLTLLSGMFDIVGGEEDPEIYEKFIVLFETTSPRSIHVPSHRHPIPGHISGVPLQTVTDILTEKLEHAATSSISEGRTSIRAEPFLTEQTLVLIIGSREFLAENLDLYLERTGLMRDELINGWKKLIALQPTPGKTRRTPTFATVNLHPEAKKFGFYSGNFDALVETIRHIRMSTSEMLERLDSER